MAQTYYNSCHISYLKNDTSLDIEGLCYCDELSAACRIEVGYRAAENFQLPRFTSDCFLWITKPNGTSACAQDSVTCRFPAIKFR